MPVTDTMTMRMTVKCVDTQNGGNMNNEDPQVEKIFELQQEIIRLRGQITYLQEELSSVEDEMDKKVDQYERKIEELERDLGDALYRGN